MKGRFHEMYGTSETGTVTKIVFSESETRLNSVGKPLGDIQIIIKDSSSDEIVSSNCRGEILIKTPLLCEGYLVNGQVIKPADYLQSGYFSTGDIGSLDDQGYLYYHGRLDDCYQVGGSNVYASDIESFIQCLDCVDWCCVVVIEDKLLGVQALPALL